MLMTGLARTSVAPNGFLAILSALFTRPTRYVLDAKGFFFAVLLSVFVEISPRPSPGRGTKREPRSVCGADGCKCLFGCFLSTFLSSFFISFAGSTSWLGFLGPTYGFFAFILSTSWIVIAVLIFASISGSFDPFSGHVLSFAFFSRFSRYV